MIKFLRSWYELLYSRLCQNMSIGGFARRLGLDLTKVRNSAGRTVGFRVVRLGYAETPISSFEVSGERLYFLVADPADLIQRCHAQGRLYETEELEIIGRHFGGGVFVDVGANVGNHLVYALKVLRASAAIAFEPEPTANAILRVNIALNNLDDKVTLHTVGLAASEGCATVENQQPHNLGSARLSTGFGDLIIKTGDMILDGPVNFIKVDTEGMELEVLGGLSQTIRTCRPTLFVEVEDMHLSAFIALLDEHDYCVVESYRRYAGMANYVAGPRPRENATIPKSSLP